MIKQVIVVRKNLGMRKGKIAAQVAHASMGVVLEESIIFESDVVIGQFGLAVPIISPAMREWLNGSFTKIVVSVNSDEEWYELLETLDNQSELPYYKITDNGATEFKGVKTDTCVAIGPAEDWRIDCITKGYPLL